MELTLSWRFPLYRPTSPMTCATAPRSMPAMRGWSSAQNGAVESRPWRLPRVSVVNPPRAESRCSTSTTSSGSCTRSPTASRFRSGVRRRIGASRRLRLFHVGVRL